MGYAEKRGDYWRTRYKIGPGKYGTVTDPAGRTLRFRTKREAVKAADDEEAKVRGGTWRDPSAGQLTFGAYASRWYAAQDLAASTMQNYRRHLEEHLLPEFERQALAEILASDVDAWARKERERGYSESSVKTWRGDAALGTGRRGRRRADPREPGHKTERAGQARRPLASPGPEKVVTGPRWGYC
jgi:hypothetical protein